MCLSCHFASLARIVRCGALLIGSRRRRFGLENAVIARTAPGLDLSCLDQNLTEGRCQKHITTWLQFSIFMPFLELLSHTKGFLTCICGIVDSVILADHGLMGEERGSFNPDTAAQGWQRLLAG